MMVEKRRKELWRMVRILIGILVLATLGTSIIFDIIFYLTKRYPHFILRILIVYLIIEALLRFTWFGREFEEFIKNKFKKFIKKSRKKKIKRI